jgi:serine/threonine-protein kinase
VISQEALREALEIQEGLLKQGRVVTLERVLVAKKRITPDAAAVLAAPDPLVAQPFASYRLERPVGEGGSSVVYAATYLPNRAKVAVKVLQAAQGLRPELVARFEEEARLLIGLEHENIVAGYELGYAAGLHYFSMDLIEGPTVLQMIERAGAIEPQTAVWVTLQTARALAYLHENGLLHRDIKPGNVMIDPTGRARLIDLGLVRKIGPAPAAPSAPAEAAGGAGDGPSPAAPPAAPRAPDEETTVGTVEYIAPEQARGRGDIDVRADIYSLGVSLYHMVVGDVPFKGESNYEVMAKHILSALETQKVKTRRIPPEVHYAITKMTSKEREQRYRTMAEVIEELTSFLPAGGPPRIVLPVANPTATASPPPAPKSSGSALRAIRRRRRLDSK